MKIVALALLLACTAGFLRDGRGIASSPWCKSIVAPRAAMRPTGKARRPRISGIFEGGATQPGGMQRRSNADGVAPRAAKAAPNNNAPGATGACFLLYQVGVGEVRRRPSAICATRLLPASTFKIPHALAALDAGVLSGADEKMAYDGSPTDVAAWRRDHTLASAMRNSVVWYFQRVAERLGMDREREYLTKFDYGNADPTSGLTTFWLGGSLQISPEEQLRFIHRLYAGELPASPAAMRTVRQLLIQPQGLVVNAVGEHPFAGPWPAGTTVSAKTGSGTDRGGKAVRWLVGHVARGPRSWIFVSCVAGGSDTPALAAVDQAASALREAGVLR